MNKNYENYIKYGIVKTSYNSSKITWKEKQDEEFAYMIIEGLGFGVFFPQRACFGPNRDGYCCDTKEEAKKVLQEVRFQEKRNRESVRAGYLSYNHKLWVHQVLKVAGKYPVYFPSVAEIKKGLEYIKKIVLSNEANKKTLAWYETNKDKSAAKVREELVENFLKI